MRFVRLDSEHAQSDGQSVNRRLPELDQGAYTYALVGPGHYRRSRSPSLTKRMGASGNEKFTHGFAARELPRGLREGIWRLRRSLARPLPNPASYAG